MSRLVPKSHWTPRYIADRVKWGSWQRRNPTLPWLVPQSVEFLDGWIRPSDVMVEYGSGRSTVWFAHRCARVISVEHHPEWHAKIKAKLQQAGRNNVDYFLIDEEEDRTPGPRLRSLHNHHRYVQAPESALKGAPVDLVLVDGMNRDDCAHWAVDHLRPGGLIVLDNVNFYLPSSTRSPGSIAHDQPPVTERWKEWVARTSKWRRVWFTTGVTDTLLVFAPG